MQTDANRKKRNGPREHKGFSSEQLVWLDF